MMSMRGLGSWPTTSVSLPPLYNLYLLTSVEIHSVVLIVMDIHMYHVVE